MKSVYLMRSNGAYKIGVSKNPQKRLRNLRIGNCCIELIYESQKIYNAYSVERELHRKFSSYYLGHEWFAIEDEAKLIDDVKNFVNKHGVLNQTSSQKTETNADADELIKWIFEPTRRKIEQIGKEIEEINKENEFLANQLMELGWTQEEIDYLKKVAENFV